jgi:hypothetical protein
MPDEALNRLESAENRNGDGYVQDAGPGGV